MSDHSKEFDENELNCEMLYCELLENLGSEIFLGLMQEIQVSFQKKPGEYYASRTIKRIAKDLVITSSDQIDGG